VGELPRTEARGLNDRFERALEGCQAQVAQQRLRAAEEAFTHLLEAATRVRAYERAVMGNAAAPEREQLKAEAEAFIASVQRWPKGGLQALQESLAAAGSLRPSDDAAREKALRTLCIRSEILSETESPAEDEALRREYQVQRLMQAMGQGTRADAADWDAMLFEWIRIGAVSPAVHASLQERFMRCRALRLRRAESTGQRAGQQSAARSGGRSERPDERSNARSGARSGHQSAGRPGDRSFGRSAGRQDETGFAARPRRRTP
jgi:hypothetical protein